MFILQTAPYEVASPDNELRVFGTLGEAKDEMERQIRARAAELGCDDYVTEREERYVFSIDDMAWIIHEVSGTFVPRAGNPNAAVSCECSGRIGTRIGDTPYKYEEL